MKVDDVLRVGPLHADGEGVRGVEGERHEAARARWRGLPEEARVDTELEQP